MIASVFFVDRKFNKIIKLIKEYVVRTLADMGTYI